MARERRILRVLEARHVDRVIAGYEETLDVTPESDRAIVHTDLGLHKRDHRPSHRPRERHLRLGSSVLG